MDVESTPLKHDHQQHCCVDHPEDDDLFRAKRTTTKTLATRTIVGVVVCVAAIVGVTYMLTSTPLIDSHAAAPVRISYMSSIIDDRRHFYVMSDHVSLSLSVFCSVIVYYSSNNLLLYVDSSVLWYHMYYGPIV